MDAVMALSLKAPVKAVLFVLARRADDKTGLCWPSLNRIAADSGNGRSTTSKAIRELKSLGLLQVTTHPRKVSDYTVNLGAFQVLLSQTQHPTSGRQGSRSWTRNPSVNLAKKSRSQKQAKSKPKQQLCMTCQTLNRARQTMNDKVCMECFRLENPIPRKVKA